jgi:hypothetical protein
MEPVIRVLPFLSSGDTSPPASAILQVRLKPDTTYEEPYFLVAFVIFVAFAVKRDVAARAQER